MKNRLIESAPADNPSAGGYISDVIGSSGEKNGYFGTVSYIYRFFEILFLSAFLIYLLFSAIGNAGEVTYSNMEYIVRNFAMKLEENSETATEIIYSPDSSMSCGLYGNGIAVCGNSGLTVFSATGRKTCSISFDLEDPVMRTSSKYILVFDNGRNYYCIFNTFSRVYEKETDYPVRGACVAGNGWYAIITGSDMYTSCVEVYDSNFKIRARYSKTGYALTADFDPEGKKIIIASVDMDDSGNYVTELSTYVIGADETESTAMIDGDIPLACRFTENYIGVVCGNSFYSYSTDLFPLNVLEYGARSLGDFAFSDSSVCLVFENDTSAINRTRSAEIYTVSGSIIGNYETSGNISSVCMSGSYAYMLVDDVPTLLTGSGTYEYRFTENIVPEKILAYAEGHIYICCSSAAYVIEFETQ